jgi:iron complex outermembrane receptor protein
MRYLLRLSLGVATGAVLASSHTAFAQESPVESDEITVTARRVNERLSDVPASITAFSADLIDRAGIQRADAFVKLTPGVTIVANSVEAGDTQINIRGINGARDAESSVALVVDGILKTNTAALNQDQGTLTQIEILKGPQGALYGRNAAAGAIVIQTRKPGDRLEGAVKASYANVGTYSGRAFISGPLGEGLGFVLSGDYRNTDGFWRSTYLDERRSVDYRENWNVDGRIVAQLGAATTLDAKARYGEVKGASLSFNTSFHLPNFAAVNPAFYEDVNAHRFSYYANILPTNSQQTFEGSLKLDHEFDGVTLSAWGLYSDIKNDLLSDGTSADFARFLSAVNPAVQPAVTSCFASTAALTGFPQNPPTFLGTSPVPFIFAPANGSTFGAYGPTTCDGTQYQSRKQRDISGEIRLASSGDNAFDWQIGAYYLNLKRTVLINLAADEGRGTINAPYNPPSSINPTTQLYWDRFNTEAYAAFASGNLELSEGFDVGVALRYDIEKRRVHNLVPLVADPFTGGPLNPGQAGGPISDQKATFKQLQPKIDIRYRFGPEATIYANWGVGFKSGGFNNLGSAAIVDQAFTQGLGSEVRISDQYRKERSSAFEAGVKGKVGPIDYSLAGYYTRVRDMQFFEFFVGSFGLLRVVSNIDRVDLKGVEFNANAKIVDGWTVYGAVNYTDSEIKKNSSRPSTVGNKSPHTADYTINLGSQMLAPISPDFKLLMRADYRVTGPTWFHTVQDQTVPTLFSGLLPISALGLPAFVGDATYDVARRKAYGVLDLRVGLEADRWNLTFFANNALNRRYLSEVITAAEFGGSFIAPGDRALYGVEAGFKF